MTKITSSDLKDEAQRLLSAGKMPSLEDLLDTVNEVRKKYKPQIEEAKSNTKGETNE
jgi:hypothetical protein